jgi:4-carboxymuconolactone decarboxylase
MACDDTRTCPGAVAGRKCPGVQTASKLGGGFEELIGRYHGRIWGPDGRIPLKYKYLMALATAVTGREKQRALLEANKAVAHGATADDVRETLELCVWLGGSPLLLEIVQPVMRFLAKRLAQTPAGG